MYSKIKNLQHFLVTPHKYFIKSERLLWLKGYRKDRLRSTLLLIIEQLQSEPEREFTQRQAYWPTDHNAPTLVLSSNTIMGYCWFYFFPWKHEYISILENKQQKWGGMPLGNRTCTFSRSLQSRISIVELADGSQVLNTLSLPSSRLLSSHGELISGLKAVRAECQCRFAFRKRLAPLARCSCTSSCCTSWLLHKLNASMCQRQQSGKW